MKVFAFLFFAVFSLSETVHAEAGSPLDLQFRFNHFSSNYHINEDGTAVESHEWSKTILKEPAIENSKQASISYSTSAQKAEVISAYTLKPGGQRLDVPKDNYQVEVNHGNGKDSPVYSDRSTLTVVFPDVSVGDTVVFSYRITQTEPLFPKQYSVGDLFFNQVAYDDLHVRIDYPADLWVQYEARDMKEAINETQGDRKIIEWTYANPTPIKTERRNYSVFDPDKEAGFAFSTFRNYAEIAEAYGKRALPKAAVTDRIRDLANEIAGKETDPEKQARALYEWVATKITYAGNCIGVGTVVPRDLDVVLDNKMGDCKDHATLLQALLTARGIKATQALVNAGAVYGLPKIPLVASVNHVINYLPDFNLYLDSTSDSTPYGMLPFTDQDKPVLLVEGYKGGEKTPIAAAGSNSQKLDVSIKIAPDGSATGDIEVSQFGQGAAMTRAWMRDMPRDVEEDLIKNIFRRQGMIGSGSFEKDDPTGLANSYHYKTSFDVEKFIRLPGAGAFYIGPPVGIVATIPAVMQGNMESETEADITCSDVTLQENYTIELPESVKVLSIPDSKKIENDFLTYEATYTLTGNVLHVSRSLVDRTKGNVCSPQIQNEYKQFAEQAMDNLKEQVLYK